MDTIEKRARELLAAEVDRDVAAMPGVEEVATSIRDGGHGGVLFVPTALRAIVAALQPPEGYVLVQETQLRHLLRDAITSVEFIAGRGQSKPLAARVRDQAWALVESVPARRKVP